MQRTLTTILLGAICLLSGCSAVATRAVMAKTASPPKPVYFAGARTDSHLILDSRESNASWFWPVYGVFDFPLSAGADILFLPYDAYADLRNSRRTTDQAPVEPP